MIGSGTQKLEWGELPVQVRRRIEGLLGGSVIHAETLPGGFSPGVAARVTTSSNVIAFIKSVSPLISEPSTNANRREAKYTRALRGNPRVPNLLHSFELGGWITLIYELVGGKHPDLPWRDEELDFVLSELTELGRSLTPCPHSELFKVFDDKGGSFRGWRNFARKRRSVRNLSNQWIEVNLDLLVLLETRWIEAATGTTLIHTDLRADQILITKDKAIFLDWPHAKIGASWLDFLFMFPSVVLQGGPSMSALVQKSPLSKVPPSELYSVAAALAGYFLWNCLQPPPQRLVTLREFQRRQGDVVVKWLEESAADLVI